MNGNELGLIIVLIVLLLIAFFVMGFLYARIHYAKIIGRIMHNNRVKMQKIEVKSEEDFHKFMKSLFEEEDDDNDDANGNDS